MRCDLLAFAAWLASAGLQAAPDPSVFRIDSSLVISLWAAEPDVVDPVAIAWDEHGRAYVAECRDYPYGAGPDGRPGSTVRLLEDRDGDGRVDHSTVFAQNISYATSVHPWRGGVLVAAAPDILFLKDTDGDGKADVRETVITGFTRGVSDSLVNGLRFGLDGWIHGANGGNGGTLASPRIAGTQVALDSDDFAFDPDTGRILRTGRSGGGFGLVFDDWGRAFTTYNIDHIQHRFLDRPDYADRAGFPPVPTTASISDHEDMSRIFPVSEAVTRPNHPEQSGHFSAAGGMGWVGDHRWPAQWRDSLFVCDVVGNLVHRDVIRPSGSAFVASRAPDEQDREFLASTDPHFRPVCVEPGPDGALYLLDMQREVIEHPDYIPAKVREKMDVRAGSDRGRIWRIQPRTTTGKHRVPALRTTADRVLALSHPNAWQRLTAQRLLLESGGKDAMSGLHRMLANPEALGRLHALWTLEWLGRLSVEQLHKALDDPSPGIRENALRMVRLDEPSQAPLLSVVQHRVDDKEPRVRLRAVLSLARSTGDETDRFESVLRRDARDPWIRRALLAAAPAASRAAIADRVLSEAQFVASMSNEALSELAASLATDPAVSAAGLLKPLARLSRHWPREARQAWLEGTLNGLARSGRQLPWSESLRDHWTVLCQDADDAELAILWKVARHCGVHPLPGAATRIPFARQRALDVSQPATIRAGAVRILDTDPQGVDLLVSFLDGRHPEEVQRAAFETLREGKATPPGVALVGRWRELSPALRPRMLQWLLEKRPFHAALLDALEQGQLSVGELNLDLEQRRRLLRGSSADIGRRASRFFGDEEYSNRRGVVADWLAKLPTQGDAHRGRRIFQESCATCHRCAGLGQKVGPELSGVTHRSVEDLLGNILDPNMAINPGFVAFQAETREGESHVGLLSQSTPGSITLLQAAGQTVVIPRQDLVRLTSTGSSLMPEGLEAGRSPQDLRDLIAFLQFPPRSKP